MAKRVFTGSSRALPVSIAAKLAELKPAALPDFGQILLVLPGKVARRNVREELLKHYANGILLPQMLTPHLLMHYQLPAANLPSPSAEELIWGKVLKHAAANAGDYPEIFFNGRTPRESFSASGQLRQLRLELAAGGFSIADASPALGSRGFELSRLESLYCKELKSCGFDDPLEVDRQAVQNTDAFAGVEKIILAGMPDLPRMLQQKLALIDEKYPGMVEIWIGDDESRADFYNQWGVPEAEKWENLCFDAPIDNIHTAIDPADGARRAMMLAAKNGIFDPAECSIVLADQSIYEDFSREFSLLRDEHGKPVNVVDPAGVSLGSLRLCRLGEKLLDYLENSDDYLYVSELIRQEDFLIYAAGNPGKASQLLKELDDFQQEAMADNFDHALKHIASYAGFRLLKDALKVVSSWHKRFKKLAAGEFLREFFTEVYLKRKGSFAVRGVTLDQECDVFTGILDSFTALPEKLVYQVEKIDLLKIFFRNCRKEKVTVALPPDAVYFEGRLEMPFLTGKRIIFCGMNERFFPDRIDLTPFLTDSIRRKIGIRSNRETFVRSLCHLRSVSLCRKPEELQLIVLRRDSDNSAMRPSGIFFAGMVPENELLARCTKLFSDPEALEIAALPPGEEGFFLKAQLDFKRDENDRMKLSVTDFDKYLKSPFDFWWENVKGMEEVDYTLCEPDPALSGTLCHSAFEKLPVGGTFKSEAELKEYLCTAFDEVLVQRFGSPLPVLIKLYAANMKQRLAYGAKYLFKNQQDGFELLASEYKFGGAEGSLDFYGTSLRGKIDRIEYHRAKNILRIVDIKTGKVSNVISEHCSVDKKSGAVEKFKKLQLPAYALLVKMDPAFRELCPMIGSAQIECAYLALPAEVTESKFELWASDKLEQILPQAESEMLRIIGEISRFSQQKLNGDPEKITPVQFKPDAGHVLQGIDWELPEKADGQTAAAHHEAVDAGKKQFPALPKLHAGDKSRCCDCPEMVRGKCSCVKGDCVSCKCFNGFKRFNIITASAGTGKTYSLASRFLQLMDYGAAPESILAITFTKKAAGEIFDKVVERGMDMVLHPEKPENHCLRLSRQRIIELLRKLLGNQTRELQISTIDSFFMQLLQAFAPELGIWGEISLIDEYDDRYRRRTIHRWVRSINDEKGLDALRELLKEADSGDTKPINATLSELTRAVHEFYQQKIRRAADGSLPQLENIPGYDISGLVEERKIPELAEKIRQEAARGIDGVFERRLNALANQLEKCASGVMYGRMNDDVADLLKTLNDKNGASWLDAENPGTLKYVRNSDVPAQLVPLLFRAFRHIRAAALQQCRLKNLAVLALISSYDRLYGKYVREAGNITFNDIPALLTSRDEDSGQIVLGSEDHSLEFRLDQQIKHYMFDEFQDTGDTQMQVFEPLLKEFFSQMYDELRSFFCVGDVKQSIYQWRSGNPELFEYVKNIMPGKDVLEYDPSDSKELSYRSAQAVMDTVNAVFCQYEGKFKEAREAFDRMKFLPHVSFKSEKPGFCSLINVAQASSRSAENIPAKSRVIAAILKKTALLERGLTVGLLVPTNAVGKEYADILKSEYGLPVSIDGTVSPVDSMAFVLFKEVLTAAYHPGDRAAEKFLEMFCFGRSGRELIPPGPQALAVKLGFPADVPLAESVRNDIFVNGLGGFAGRFLESFGRQCSKFDRHRLEILYNAACAFTGTPDEFLRRAEKLGQGGKSLDSTIQIMTGHKSKGLEFDAVFLPDTTLHSNNGKNYLPEAQIIRYSESEEVREVLDPKWVSYMPNKYIVSTIPEFAGHMKQKEYGRVLEKCCSLYVEMTRAKSALFILTSRNNTDGAFSPDKVLLEQLVAYGVQRSDLELKSLLSDPEIAEHSPALLYSHGDWHWYIKAAPELKKAGEKSGEKVLTLPHIHLEKRRERMASGEKSVEFVTDPEKRFSSLNGKSIGTQVHELFEKISFIPADFDPGKFAADSSADPIAAEIFCRAMEKDSPIRAALSESADGREKEVWCEKRFLLRNPQGEIIPGAFDRVVIFKENGIPAAAEIFDYKSDNMQSAAEFAVYFPQLKLYRESLAQMLALPPEKIACRILALKIKEVITVD